ncbi:MAG: hypothetical protein LBG12_11175 [Synergistaceae bacterium]|nr:hypothetical protein [Synergistaceae bacterium]
MILRACEIDEFIRRNRVKEVVCFGAGNWLQILSDEFQSEIESVYAYAVDSNHELWGSVRSVGKRVIDVRPPQFLYENINPDTVILISSGEHHVEIYEHLNSMEALRNTECYIVSFIHNCELDRIAYGVSFAPENFQMNSKPVIPKIIHYTWFSGERLPDGAKRCIDSWSEHCPDYEIKEWNADNYDLTKHNYVYEAIQAKKWGFAGDYVRLDVIYNHGGFYFDLDVELLRNIDELRYNSAFCGFETARTINLGSGFGALKGHRVIKKLRDCYDDVPFIRQDGTLNLEASPFYQTKTLMELGANINCEFQVIDDLAIYPAIYFAPKSLLTERVNKSPYSYSIHNFEGSWLTEEDVRLRSAELAMKRQAMSDGAKIEIASTKP